MDASEAKQGGARFTPGPWKVYRTDDGHEIRMATALRLPKGQFGPYTIHTITYDHGCESRLDGFREAAANARLIAAAPDLFAAAKDVIEQAATTGFPLGPDLADSIRVFLAKAVAKAEGR